MQTNSEKDGFGRLIDLVRIEPVTVEKHGRPVVVVMAVGEYERLKNIEVGRGGRKQNKNNTAHPTDVEEN